MSAVKRRRNADWQAGRGGARPGPTGVLRSLLLGVAVFTLTVLTGALLAGAAPADPLGRPGAPRATSAGVAEAPGATSNGAGTGSRVRAPGGSSAAVPAPDPRAGNPAADQDFAQSMVYSGGLGLLLSIFGAVMVGRRRRLW